MSDGPDADFQEIDLIGFTDKLLIRGAHLVAVGAQVGGEREARDNRHTECERQSASH